MTPIPTITDDLLREIEDEYRATDNTHRLSPILPAQRGAYPRSTQ